MTRTKALQDSDTYGLGTANAKHHWGKPYERMEAINDRMIKAGASIWAIQELDNHQWDACCDDKRLDGFAPPPNNRFPGGGWSGNAIVWIAEDWERVRAKKGRPYMLVRYIWPLHDPVVTLRNRHTGHLHRVLCIHNPNTFAYRGDGKAKQNALAMRQRAWLLRQRIAASVHGDFNNVNPWPRTKRLFKVAQHSVDQVFANRKGLKDLNKERTVSLDGLSDHDATVGLVHWERPKK